MRAILFDAHIMQSEAFASWNSAGYISGPQRKTAGRARHGSRFQTALPALASAPDRLSLSKPKIRPHACEFQTQQDRKSRNLGNQQPPNRFQKFSPRPGSQSLERFLQPSGTTLLPKSSDRKNRLALPESEAPFRSGKHEARKPNRKSFPRQAFKRSAW